MGNKHNNRPTVVNNAIDVLKVGFPYAEIAQNKSEIDMEVILIWELHTRLIVKL